MSASKETLLKSTMKRARRRTTKVGLDVEDATAAVVVVVEGHAAQEAGAVPGVLEAHTTAGHLMDHHHQEVHFIMGHPLIIEEDLTTAHTIITMALLVAVLEA